MPWCFSVAIFSILSPICNHSYRSWSSIPEPVNPQYLPAPLSSEWWFPSLQPWSLPLRLCVCLSVRSDSPEALLQPFHLIDSRLFWTWLLCRSILKQVTMPLAFVLRSRRHASRLVYSWAFDLSSIQCEAWWSAGASFKGFWASSAALTINLASIVRKMLCIAVALMWERTCSFLWYGIGLIRSVFDSL